MKLKNKTLFLTGGSRGIGLAIAKRAASEGANVVICPTVPPVSLSTVSSRLTGLPR